MAINDIEYPISYIKFTFRLDQVFSIRIASNGENEENEREREKTEIIIFFEYFPCEKCANSDASRSRF